MPAKRENFVPDTVYARIMDGKAIFPTAVSVEGKRMIFLSGQLAWDKDGNTVGKGDMRAQFEQVSENLKNGLEAAGASRHDDRDRHDRGGRRLESVRRSNLVFRLLPARHAVGNLQNQLLDDGIDKGTAVLGDDDE